MIPTPTFSWEAVSLALPAGFTVSRASQATYTDSTGVTRVAVNNQPRFHYDRRTKLLLGLLLEAAADNLLLNSAVLATQTVNVAAVPHVLSFIGTGDIQLSGASTQKLVGLNDDERVNLIFTPTALPTAWLDYDAASLAVPSGFTFTRASTGTYFDVAGVMQTAAINAPRFTYDPITHEFLGLLCEEQATNLLLNSSILVTQSVAVTAVQHTLSFYGTGNIVLSGAHVATVNSAGGRTTFLFTPTAGSLTLTVTGSVTNAQLETGNGATSYIPTTGATVTRSRDLCERTGLSLNQKKCSFHIQFRPSRDGATAVTSNGGTFFVGASSASLTTSIRVVSQWSVDRRISGAGTSDAMFTKTPSVPYATPISVAFAMDDASAYAEYGSDALLLDDVLDPVGLTSPLTVMRLGIGQTTNQASCTIRRFRYWDNIKLSQDQVKMLSADQTGNPLTLTVIGDVREAQLESNTTYPSTWIPTTSAPATRADEFLGSSMAGYNLDALNITWALCFMPRRNGRLTNPDSTVLAFGQAVSTTNSTRIATTSGRWRATRNINAAGADYALVCTTPMTQQKFITLVYGIGDGSATFVPGADPTMIAPLTNLTPVSVTTVRLNASANGSDYILASLKIWNRKITDAEMQEVALSPPPDPSVPYSVTMLGQATTDDVKVLYLEGERSYGAVLTLPKNSPGLMDGIMQGKYLPVAGSFVTWNGEAPPNGTVIPLATLGIQDTGKCTILYGGKLPTIGGASNQQLVAVDDGTADNRVYLRQNNAGLTTVDLVRYVAAGASAVALEGNVAVNVPFRAGMSCLGDANARATLNGGAVATRGMPATGLKYVRIGGNSSGAEMPSAPAQMIKIIPGIALSDADLQKEVLKFNPIVFKTPAINTNATLASMGVLPTAVSTILFKGVFTTVASGTQYMVYIGDGTPDYALYLRQSSAGNILIGRIIGGTTVGFINTGIAVKKVELRVGVVIPGDGTMRAYQNGGSVVSISGAQAFALTTLTIGSSNTGVNTFKGTIGEVRVHPTLVPSDSELQDMVKSF